MATFNYQETSFQSEGQNHTPDLDTEHKRQRFEYGCEAGLSSSSDALESQLASTMNQASGLRGAFPVTEDESTMQTESGSTTNEDHSDAHSDWSDEPEHEDSETNILRYIPKRMSKTKLILDPGGLPVELWYHIIESIDDLESFHACGVTCKLLACLIKQIEARYADALLEVDEISELKQLHHQVSQQSPKALLRTWITVGPALLPQFILRFLGRIHRLQVFLVSGTLLETPLLPALRRQLLTAAACFHTVTYLLLYYFEFWSFADFARLICAFRNLRHLELNCVSWQGGEGRTLAEEPFAKALRLQEIKIFDDNISRFAHFLAAPRLPCWLYTLQLRSQQNDLSLEYRAYHAESQQDTFFNAPTLPYKATISIPEDISVSEGTDAAKWMNACFDLLDGFIVPSGSTESHNSEFVVEVDGWDIIMLACGQEPSAFSRMHDRGINVMHPRARFA